MGCFHRILRPEWLRRGQQTLDHREQRCPTWENGESTEIRGQRKDQGDETPAAPTGFGYAAPSEGALRGHLLTADEAMWVDGMRLAEENEMDDGDADDEESDGAEEAREVIAETSAITVPTNVTVNASGELISMPSAGPRSDRQNNTIDDGKLINLSPEVVSNVAAIGEENGAGAAEETMFDRDLEREIKKEGCEMQ